MFRPVVLAVLAAVFLACDVRAAEDQQEPSNWAASNGPNPETLFNQLDENADGQLAADEVDDQHRRLFQRLVRRHDADENGTLSLSEFTAGLKEAPPEIPADEPRGPGQENEQLKAFLQADPAELFKKLDANADGKVVLDEVPEPNRPQFGQFFERADVNRDKSLTLDEFRKGHEQVRQYLGAANPGQGKPGQANPGQGAQGGGPGAPGQAIYRALDLDGDGTLSADEIAKAADSLKKLDQDGDGAVSRQELVRGGQVAAGAGRPAAPGPNTQRFMERLKQMDKDGDGKLSKEELPPFLQQRFDQLDANGDGFVGTDELRSAAQAMQQRNQQGGGQNRPKPNGPNGQKRPPAEN
jgi:Ca2+-binding EF-hand superfamily protein